jgi:hypothetical protein
LPSAAAFCAGDQANDNSDGDGTASNGKAGARKGEPGVSLRDDCANNGDAGRGDKGEGGSGKLVSIEFQKSSRSSSSRLRF